MERTLLTIKQFAVKHPAFTQGALRALVHKAGQHFKADGTKTRGNGLIEQGALIRIGDRVLLDEAKFFNWIDAQQQVTA